MVIENSNSIFFILLSLIKRFHLVPLKCVNCRVLSARSHVVRNVDSFSVRPSVRLRPRVIEAFQPGMTYMASKMNWGCGELGILISEVEFLTRDGLLWAAKTARGGAATMPAVSRANFSAGKQSGNYHATHLSLDRGIANAPAYFLVGQKLRGCQEMLK